MLNPHEPAPLHAGRPLLLDVGGIVPDHFEGTVKIEATCVLVDVNGKATCSVYAHDLRDPDYAVTYEGYRPQIEGPNQGESFQLNLNALSAEIAAVYVVASSDPIERFGNAQLAFLDLHYGSEEQAEHFARYELPGLTNSHGALLARLFRNGDSWYIDPLRFKFQITSVNELAGKATEHWGWYPPHAA